MTIEDFREIIPNICSKETSSDSENWSLENPTWGHCAIVALLAQEYFGGTILKKSLKNIPELKHIRSHFFNKLRDAIEEDFTRQQFQGILPENLEIKEDSREDILAYPGTKERYQILRARFKDYCLK